MALRTRDIPPPIARAAFSGRRTRGRPGVEFPAHPRHSDHDKQRKPLYRHRDFPLRIWPALKGPTPHLRHWPAEEMSLKNKSLDHGPSRTKIFHGRPHVLSRKWIVSRMPAKAQQLIHDVLWPLSRQARRSCKTSRGSSVAPSAIANCGRLAAARECRNSLSQVTEIGRQGCNLGLVQVVSDREHDGSRFIRSCALPTVFAPAS